MILPKIVQMPDYSEFLFKEFILTEDIYMNNVLERPMLKGVRFIIKKIKNNKVTIKISNTKEELEKLGMLEYDFNRVINQIKKEIKQLKKVCNLWKKEPNKFVINSDDFWNKDGGHCINTGYRGIPFDHPHKYGTAKAYYNDKGEYTNDDSIMTMNYLRTDNLPNIYSYQRNKNYYYSKECYEFMLKGREQDLDNWEKRNPDCKKLLLNWILEKQEIKISTLNKMSFNKYIK